MKNRDTQAFRAPLLWIARLSAAALVWISLLPFAAAQSKPNADAKWEFEVHAGATLPNNPTGGVGALPPLGDSFTTIEGTPSRSVYSWFFGDGALLLNQVQALAPSSPDRITPLDFTLMSSMLHRDLNGIAGVRLSRKLNARLSAEVSGEFCTCRPTLTSEGMAGIEASRASFDSTWQSFFSDWKSNAPVVPASAHATSAVDENKQGGRMSITGALNVALKTQGKVIPYLTVGAGIESQTQGIPVVTLTGGYSIRPPNTVFPFPNNGGFPSPNIVHSNTVTMRFDAGKMVFVGVVGGGIKFNMNSRWGLRFDVRMHLGMNPVNNLVEADSMSVGSFRIPPIPSTYVFGGNPSIQFSNTLPSILGDNPQSSLGKGLESFRTFSGSGIQGAVIGTAGVFRRF